MLIYEVWLRIIFDTDGISANEKTDSSLSVSSLLFSYKSGSYRQIYILSILHWSILFLWMLLTAIPLIFTNIFYGFSCCSEINVLTNALTIFLSELLSFWLRSWISLTYDRGICDGDSYGILGANLSKLSLLKKFIGIVGEIRSKWWPSILSVCLILFMLRPGLLNRFLGEVDY